MAVYQGDFETTRNPDGSMRVWLSDLCELTHLDHYTHTSIDEMMQWLYKHDDNAIIYYHNLKFDGTYILYWLFANGFQHSTEGIAAKTYDCLVTDKSQWFAISITTPSGGKIQIFDSLKKIPLPVAKIAKAYNLPMSKGEIDYKMQRPMGYIPTQEELDYIHMDTEIVARALVRHFEQGMNKMTAPADAIEDLKKKCDFEKLFQTRWWTTHKSAETFCRRAYSGGISWVNPAIKDKVVKHGVVYDYNSMYPSVMLMYEYPVGVPVKWYDRPPKGYPLYIARCRVDIMKMKDTPACIRHPSRAEWIEDEYEGEIWLTSVDIENLQAAYCGECELLEGYAFKGQKGVFDKFINEWAEIKKTTKDKGMRQIAKLMLNSCYGKFGTNPNRAHKIPNFETGTLKWDLERQEDGKVFNVSVAAYVTAYARRELVRTIMSCQGFCYCDTDSVHLASIDGKAARFVGKVHESDFGCWKLENRFVRAKYLRQKTYIEEKADGKLLIAACGCPESAKNYITFDNFRIGASYKGKLRPIQRVGGCELVDSKFTIKVAIDRF